MEHSNPFTEQAASRYFVGRERELTTFRLRLIGLANGQPAHAFVAGLHGSGKSFFLDQLIEEAGSKGFVGVVTDLDLGESPSANAAIAKIIRATAKAVQSYRGSEARNLTEDLGPRSAVESIRREPRTDRAK